MAASPSIRTDGRSLFEVAVRNLSQRPDPLYRGLIRPREGPSDLPLDFPELLLQPERSLRDYRSQTLNPTDPLFSELNRLIALLEDGDEVKTAYLSYIESVCRAEGKSRWKLLKGEVRLIARLPSEAVCLLIPRKIGKEIVATSSIGGLPLFTRSAEEPNIVIQLENLSLDRTPLFFGIAGENRPILFEKERAEDDSDTELISIDKERDSIIEESNSHLEAKNYRLASLTLINASLQIEEQFDLIESSFLRDTFGIETLTPSTILHRELLNKVRSNALKAMNSGRPIDEVQRVLGRGYKKLLSTLFDECLKLVGVPPSRYALIALDGLSREELFPFSGMRLALLVERADSVDHFRNIANLLELKILRLRGSGFSLQEPIITETAQGVAHLLPLSLHSSLLHGESSLLLQQSHLTNRFMHTKKGSFLGFGGTYEYQTQALLALKSYLNRWQRVQNQGAPNKKKLDLQYDLYHPFKLALQALLLFFDKSQLTTRQGIYQLPFSTKSKNALSKAFNLLSSLMMRSQLRGNSTNEADQRRAYQLLTSLYQTLSIFIERPKARTLQAASLTFASKESSSIHLAAERRDNTTVQQALTQSERIDSAGYTPLHLAIINQQPEAVASLLEHMHQNPLEEGSISPLHLAVENGHYEIANLLLNHYPLQKLIELKDRNGETALHWAARKGHLELVQLLLERGASSTTNNQKGENPFEIALKKGQDDVAQLILFYPSNISEEPGQKELFSLVKLADDCWKGKRPDRWIPEYLNEKPNFWVAALILNIACFNAKKVAPLCEDLLLHQLEQLEYSFVQHELGRSIPYTNRIRNYRAQLREIRERAAKSLRQRFPVPIDTVLLELTQDYKKFLADLLNECIAIKGEAPPRFAMVGLGSMSRNEMCPFSDVEFIFLIEDDNEEILSYFRSITRLISLKIANLGETNYSLPGRYSSKTGSIPSGFKMDSVLSPFGQRGLYEENADELIGTPQRLANLQTNQSKDIIIRNAMSTSCLIAGEPALLRTYQKQVRLHLTSKAPGSEQTRGNLMALELIGGDVKDFAPQLTQKKIDERAFGIKQELYRLPQALINALCLYHGIRGTNAFQRIDRLQEKGLFSITGANQLKRVFRSVLKTRFNTHLFYGEEKEILYYSRPGDNSEAEGLFIITPELNKEINELYRILIPFHQKAQEFLDGNRNAFSNCSFYDQAIGNYDEKATEDLKTNRHLTSAQSFAIFNLNNPFPHLNLGDAQLKIGEVREAIAQFKETLSLLEQKYGTTPHRKTAVALQRLGHAHEELGEYLLAIDYYKKALAIYQETVGQFSSEAASCLMSLGNAYYSLDEYDQAIAFYNKSLTIKNLFYGEGADLDVAQSLHNLGCIYQKLCEYSKSLHHLERSLAAFKSIYQNQPSHPDIATNLRNLGQVYLKLGDYSQALEYQQKSLKMNLEIFGDRPDPAVATSYLDLGYLYESLGEYRRAISCHKKSLELSNLFHKDQNNLLAASSLTGLGNIYSQLEDYDLAAESYQTVLKITQEIYGDQPHSSVAMALYNLASAFKDLGQSKQSMEYHEKALAMRREIYRSLPHSDIVLSLLAIGSAHSSLRKHQLAITFFEEALATKKIITRNPFDPGFSPILNYLGDANLFLSQYDQAVKFYEDALEILKKTHGSRPHPEMVGTLNNLGRAYRKANNYQRSILYCSQAIELTTQIYGETHPKMAACLGNLGETFFAFDDPIKAIDYHQRALAIQKETYRDHLNISIAYSLNNLGDIYEELGDYPQAKQHYQEALEVKRKIYLDWPHPSLINSLLNLGRICSKLAELTKAAQYYQESLVIAKQAYDGEAHPDIVDCLANLGNALRSLGEQRRAVEYYEQSLTMFKQIYGDKPDPTISALFMSLSDGYNNLGEFDHALEYSTASLSREKQIHGDEPHHYVGIALNNLGDTYKGLGQLDRAIELYQSASEMYLQTVGADHPHAVETKESLEATLKMREESKVASPSST